MVKFCYSQGQSTIRQKTHQNATASPVTKPIWFITTKRPRCVAGDISLTNNEVNRCHIPALAGVQDKPLVQRNCCRSNCSSKPTYDPASDHHRKSTCAKGPSLEAGAKTDDDGSEKSWPSSANAVAQRPRKEDIACPRAQVVDSRDETLFGSTRIVQELDETGRNVDGSKDSDVIPSRWSGLLVLQTLKTRSVWRLHQWCTNPHKNDPCAKKAQRRCMRKLPLLNIGMVTGWGHVWINGTLLTIVSAP